MTLNFNSKFGKKKSKLSGVKKLLKKAPTKLSLHLPGQTGGDRNLYQPLLWWKSCFDITVPRLRQDNRPMKKNKQKNFKMIDS